LTRVLIGDFNAIVRLGLTDLLEEAGCEIVGDVDGEQSVVAGIEETRPDVVLVGEERVGGGASARNLSVTFPSVTVIALSPDGPSMRVYPRYHRGESYRCALSPAELVRESTGLRSR
jgi:DNA-binding NarL/FixJ family response regulator